MCLKGFENFILLRYMCFDIEMQKFKVLPIITLHTNFEIKINMTYVTLLLRSTFTCELNNNDY